MASAFVHLSQALLTGWMGEWRSGSAAALHAVGRGFESLFAYHSPPFFRDQGGPWGDYSRAPSITAPKIPSITSKTSFSRFLRRRLGLDVSLAGGTHTAFGEPD